MLLSKQRSGITIEAESDSIVLVLTGEPIEEPIASDGPFRMNSQAEIRKAIEDFNSGRFGQMAHA